MVEQQTEVGTFCGVYPTTGDLAWLTKASTILYKDKPAWFRVLKVRPSTLQGWVYLHGYEAEERVRTMRAVFVKVDGLVIRRGY
jgi:hypothetical protein